LLNELTNSYSIDFITKNIDLTQSPPGRNLRIWLWRLPRLI